MEAPNPHSFDSPNLIETIRMAQRGDAAAFEFLYRLHCRRVYALCLRIARDPNEAEDLTQEAFLQLFRKIDTFRGESAFSSWLYRLTVNMALMRFRKKKLHSISLDEFIASDEENSAPTREFGETDLRLTGLFDRANLQKAINQLPESCKALFILHDVKGYEHNEIARMLGCSVGTSKSQVHRARKRLRKILQSLKHYGTPQGCATSGDSLALAGSH
jgi:RNA polymerase sigma-70 factor (ECF subfamily)